MSAVTHEPIFDPKIMYKTAFPPSAPPIYNPAAAILIIIVVTALEDCKSAVNTIPKSKSKNGLVKEDKRSCTSFTLVYSLIEPDMISNPKNTIPNPAKASPMDLSLSFLKNISIIIPIKSKKIKNGAISKDDPPEPSAAICAVIVVPIFAPMIIVAA